MKFKRLFFVLLATSFLLVGCGGTDLVITTDPAPTDPAPADPTPTAPTAPDLTTRQGLFDAYGASLLAGDVPAIMALYDTGYLATGVNKATEEVDLGAFFGGGDSYSTASFSVINQATYGGLEIVEVNLNLADSTGFTLTDYKLFYYLINTAGNFYLHGNQWDGVRDGSGVATNCPYTGTTAGSTVALTPGFSPVANSTISRATGVALNMTYDHTITSDHPASVIVAMSWSNSGAGGTQSFVDIIDMATLIQPAGTVFTAVAPPAANLTLPAPTVDGLGAPFTPDNAFLMVLGGNTVCGAGATPMDWTTYLVGP